MTEISVNLARDTLEYIQTAPTKVLLGAINGRIDRLASKEIANRGLDPSGDWVDFEEASKQAEFAN
jgi:hypothetical protein